MAVVQGSNEVGAKYSAAFAKDLLPVEMTEKSQCNWDIVTLNRKVSKYS